MSGDRQQRKHLRDTARGTIADAQRALDSIQALQKTYSNLRLEAETKVKRLLDTKAANQLAQMPVSSLKSAVSSGTRLTALQSTRFRTVGDLSASSPVAIASTPGIGAASAKDIYAAARDKFQRARAEAVIQFDTTLRVPEEETLLQNLAALHRADQIWLPIQDSAKQLSTQIVAKLSSAKRVANRTRMLFTSPSKKELAFDSLSALDKLLLDPQVHTLIADLEASIYQLLPEANELQNIWDHYRENTAAINTQLSLIQSEAEKNIDQTPSEFGQLPTDLVERVQDVPLRTHLLKTSLRGYQVFGAQFAIHQKKTIIGDEMGVGKTLQAIAHAADLAVDKKCCFLVVCPASVLINWANEIRKHSQLLVHSLHGTTRDYAVYEWRTAGGFGVTTFGTLNKLDLDRLAIALVIIDEAHFIKNPAAQRTQAARSAMMLTERVMFLTGTPMENRVDEFRMLVSYLQPAVAASLRGSDNLFGAGSFRRAVSPVYLRRNQADVLRELPEKIEVDDWIRPSPVDQAHYADAVKSRNFMAMRQAAFVAGAGSAKLRRIQEIVSESAENGRKVLIFSFFLSVLKTVDLGLPESVIGTITGAVASSQRQSLIDRFTRTSGPAVLLSQIEAGGVGLNIQAASVVIITEPQWKPSTEAQAISRAHRMGQPDKVLVHRMLAKDQVDERIKEILQRKTVLFDAYARPSEVKDVNPNAIDSSFQEPRSNTPSSSIVTQIIDMEILRLNLA